MFIKIDACNGTAESLCQLNHGAPPIARNLKHLCLLCYCSLLDQPFGSLNIARTQRRFTDSC